MLRAVVKTIRNTHRHPVNQALHFIGAPFYIIGLAMVFMYLAGGDTNPLAGLALWLSAIAMFVTGHKIEGNAMSLTPLLILRLLSRKVAGYAVAQRVHLV